MRPSVCTTISVSRSPRLLFSLSKDKLAWIDKLIQLGFDGDEVINSLVGNLVSYLAQKEIIDQGTSFKPCSSTIDQYYSTNVGYKTEFDKHMRFKNLPDACMNTQLKILSKIVTF